MRFSEKICKDPFRLFFPFAILFALYACSLWILFSFFDAVAYPGLKHAELFIGGFLYLVIFGFLMTAIPRFTESSFASISEIKMSFALIIGLLASTLFQARIAYWVFISSGWILLSLFALKRFSKRTQDPPYTFLFVALGILMGITGSYSILISLVIKTNFSLEHLGKVLFYDGMVLSLILGVGGRLIPGILGFQEIVSSQRKVYESPGKFIEKIPVHIFILIFLLVLTFILEVYDFLIFSYILRAFVITFFAFKYWRIHKSPPKKSKTNFFIRVSCFFILIAPWLVAIFPDYLIDLKHLTYIGGYSLITFLIAARVILAHGKEEGLNIELNHYPYTFFSSALIIATLTRSTAILMPETYLNHLGYAAFMYLIGLLVWALRFFPFIRGT